MDTVERGAIKQAAKEQQQEDSGSSSTRDAPNLDRDVEKTGAEVREDHQTESAIEIPPLKGLSWLDRLLVLWILLAMAIGLILGNFVPDVNDVVEQGTFVGVSIPIAVGLLVMMYPILCKVRYEELHLLLKSSDLWKQLAFSFVLNWIIAPVYMFGLAWAFLPDREGLREGLIYVGIARCIAMVLIWTDLAGGDGNYCAVLVAFNSILQIVLFAPFAIFFVKVCSHASNDVHVEYSTVATSVGVFLGIPLGAAVLTRFILRSWLGERRYQLKFIRYIAPLSLIGLVYTIIMLFALQGKHVVNSITSVLRVAAPLVVYFLSIFPLTAVLCWKFGFGYKASCTQSFTGASNNFELAIAVTVAVYGVQSDQALASTVGPLIEVPVLVTLVYVIKWVRRRWNWKA